MFSGLLETYVMIVFQVSLNFDPTKEILLIRRQIYILMKKVIILGKIQGIMKTFTPPFFNHCSLSLNRKKRVTVRAMRKKLQKQLLAEILENNCSSKISEISQENTCVGVSF